MARTPLEYRQEALDLFLENFSGKELPKLEYFHAFLCPVAIAEATVREYIVEDFDVLQLLVLRLYEAGFHDPAYLASLCGMQQAMVEKALENEIYVAGHIHHETGQLTEMGRKTLEASRQGKAESHMIYTTARRLQVEAATGTVIPAYLEDREEYMQQLLPDDQEGIVPRETVEQDAEMLREIKSRLGDGKPADFRESVNQDEELLRELNNRLSEYQSKDIVAEKAPIKGFSDLHSTQILFRWAYITKFAGMEYPMIVMRGRRTVSNVNAQSVREGAYGKNVALPLALAETDSRYLRSLDLDLEQVLVREDRFFKYLQEKAQSLDLLAEERQLQEVSPQPEPEEVTGDV